MKYLPPLLLVTLLSTAVLAADHGGHGDTASRSGPAAWTRYPLLVTTRSPDRISVRVAAANLEAGTLDVYAPRDWDGNGHWRLPLAAGAAVTASPETGNYHWFAATTETPERVVTASTAHYFGHPGPAPTALLRAPKAALEIVPQPLPREHSGYRENEEWPFVVRLNGAPLPDFPLALETANGSRAVFLTDAAGVARVRFPADFPPSAEGAGGHGERRQAAFVLAAERREQGRVHLTTFNAAYGPDAFSRKSLAAGTGFALLGMVLAAPLLRRKNTKETSHD